MNLLSVGRAMLVTSLLILALCANGVCAMKDDAPKNDTTSTRTDVKVSKEEQQLVQRTDDTKSSSATLDTETVSIWREALDAFGVDEKTVELEHDDKIAFGGQTVHRTVKFNPGCQEMKSADAKASVLFHEVAHVVCLHTLKYRLKLIVWKLGKSTRSFARIVRLLLDLKDQAHRQELEANTLACKKLVKKGKFRPINFGMSYLFCCQVAGIKKTNDLHPPVDQEYLSLKRCLEAAGYSISCVIVCNEDQKYWAVCHKICDRQGQLKSRYEVKIDRSFSA